MERRAGAVSLLAATVWLLLMLLYVAKWIWLRAEALAEYHHPILCCFVGIVPVTTALVGWQFARIGTRSRWCWRALGWWVS